MGASGEEGAAAADAEDAGGGASAGHAPCAGLSDRGAGGGSGSGCVQVLMTSLWLGSVSATLSFMES